MALEGAPCKMALGKKTEIVNYAETRLVNSNKCFTVFG